MADNPPDWLYTAFYYPEILAQLLAFKAHDFPEHTETNPHDPIVQFYRLAALVFHGANTRLDHVAREAFLATAQLRASFVAQAPLLGYQLAPPTPATVDVVVDVSGSVPGTATITQPHSVWSTAGDDTTPAVVFEFNSDDPYTVTATGSWLVTTSSDDGATMNAIDTSAPFVLFGGVPDDYPLAFFGHADAMFDKIGISFSAANDTITEGVWEYYDDARILVPDDVQDNSGNPQVTIDSLIYGGVAALVGRDLSNGSEGVIRVTCKKTGAFEDCYSAFSGGHMYATPTSTLGQSTVSYNPNDYTVQTFWPPLPLISDGTVDSDQPLNKDGTVAWTLPQATDRRWAKTTIGTRTAYWIRMRVQDHASADGPTMKAPAEPVRTTWSVLLPARQGERVVDKLGASSGAASQSWTLPHPGFVELVSVTVDGEAWARVVDFLTATTFDKVFTLDEQPDSTWLVAFGDGTHGRIPAESTNVIATYRVNADTDGDVGPLVVKIDRSGNSKAKGARNPRAAVGWTVREGLTALSRAELVRKIPAELRALDRAVTAEDYETLSTAFKDAAGNLVAERVAAVEEGAGPKTVLLYVVGLGGVAPSAPDLAELVAYFNGIPAGLQRIGGHCPANTTVVGQSFVPHSIDVDATISILADFASNAQAVALAALKGLMTPTAKRLTRAKDGTISESTAYQWRWGDDSGGIAVTKSIVLGRIASFLEGIVDIDLGGFSDVVLDPGELPTNGTITVSIVEV